MEINSLENIHQREIDGGSLATSVLCLPSPKWMKRLLEKSLSRFRHRRLRIRQGQKCHLYLVTGQQHMNMPLKMHMNLSWQNSISTI
jgi:hypothetical protein